jgi:ferredoxin--NADP+ reductase
MQILNKEILGQTPDTSVTRIVVNAPDIAHKARPGQFAVLMVNEEGERIPLTIVDCDRDKGSVTFIFQEAGLTTKLLGRLNQGDSLYVLVGPLGHPTEIIPPQRDPAIGGKNYGRVILVGGGVGIAEIYPVAKALKEAGNQVVTVLGARTKDLLILEKELKSVSDELHITTDDGSYGRKGFVTDVLKEVLDRQTGRPADRQTDLVYAVGPIPMMRRVCAVTQDFKIKTMVSLNALMVDATGMCGCCRVTVAGKTKFSCVDGPEFDGHLVDWDGLTKRNAVYLDQEKHICNLLLK